MKAFFKNPAWLLLAAVCTAADGMQYQVLGLMENIEAADRIVIGRLELEHGKTVLRVTETLKGAPVEMISGGFQHLKGSGVEPDVLMMESRMARSMRGYVFHRTSYLPRYSREWNLLQMLKDPSPYLDENRYPPHADRITMLGYLFEGYRIQCKEVPGLFAVWQSRHHITYPWSIKEPLEFKCRVEVDDEPRLTVTGESGGSEWWKQAARHISSSRMYLPDTGAKLPATITVMVDGRKVPKVGSLTHEAARDFLRSKLQSEDLRIAKAALLALARMRDSESVPAVTNLLGDAREELVAAAVDFLGWSRDRQAVPILRDMLAAKAVAHPATAEICQKLVEALQRIGDESAVPELVFALQCGVDPAGYALGPWSSAETIGRLLETERRILPRSAGLVMHDLVRRSNVPPSEWPQKTHQMLSAPEVLAWKQWWTDHREGFQIVMDRETFAAIVARENKEEYDRMKARNAMRKGPFGRLFGERAGTAKVILSGLVLLVLGLVFRRRYLAR